jgi:hypothetical protein
MRAFLPSLLLIVPALLVSMPRTADALMLTGTPSCDSGDCTITVEANPEVEISSSLVVDIVLENMQHIELIDSDPAPPDLLQRERFEIELALDNFSGDDVAYRLTTALTDMNNDIIDPPGDFHVFEDTLADSSGLGGLSFPIDFFNASPLILHGVRLTIEVVSGGPLELNAVEFAQFGMDSFGNGDSFDPESNVGVWVPEPTTTLLLACGLVGLGVLRRRH